MWRQPYHLSIYLYTRHDLSIKLCSIVYSSLFILTLLWLGYSLFLAKWCSMYQCPRHCQVYEKPKASTGTAYMHWSNPATKDQVIESCETSGKSPTFLSEKNILTLSFFGMHINFLSRCLVEKHFCVNLDCEPKQIDVNVAWNPVLFGKFVSNDICILFGHVPLTR